MTHTRTSLLLAFSAALLLSGCSSNRYYAAAPPPPPYGYRIAPQQIDIAEHQGFRAGADDGARDAYAGKKYRPEHDRKFHDTPGYDPRLGPYGAYRDSFRNGYVHGYDNGFRRR